MSYSKEIKLLFIFAWISNCFAFGPEHERILQWWQNEASQLKPLKCSINPNYLTEDHPEVAQKWPYIEPSTKVIISRKCEEDEAEPYFDFKGSGKVVDGILEGAGKLKIYKKAKIDAMFGGAKSNGSCLTLSLLNGGSMREIIGTFKNGTLEGMAKIMYSNGHKLIANFHNGYPDGLKRLWNENDKLSEVSYFSNNSRKGFYWSYSHGNYVMYSDASFVIDDDIIYTLFVPLNSSEEILAGTYFSPFGIVDNLHGAQVEITSHEKDCILNLKWSKKEKKDFRLVLSEEEVKMPLNHEENMNCKAPNVSRALNAQDKFKAWCSHVLSMSQDEFTSAINMYQVKPETSPVEHDKVKLPFLTNFTLISRNKANMSIWNGPILTFEAVTLRINSLGDLNGVNFFKLNEESYNQTGEHDFLNWKIRSFFGSFHNGVLEGPATLFTWKGAYIFATFKEGVLHGPMFAYGVTPILHIEARGFIFNPNGMKLNDIRGAHGITFYGRFKNGQAQGNFWVEMLSSGYLHGKVDDNGHITGDDLAFIYMDGVTAFKGRFEDKFMRKAYNVDVLEYGCDENGLFQATKFTEPLSEQIFSYDPCTNESFGGGAPLGVRDPYEVKTVTLAPSSVPNSGEGVFLLRDIPAHQFAALYSLFLYQVPEQDDLYTESCVANISKSDEYRRHCMKYSLGVSMYHGIIHLPPELDVNPLPNHGPKVNHHFSKNNSAYSEIEHPRFGLIQSVTPSRDVKAGEELFTNYGYKMRDFPSDFPWYWEMKTALGREERLQNQANEAKKAKKDKPKKKKNKSRLVKS